LSILEINKHVVEWNPSIDKGVENQEHQRISIIFFHVS